MTNLDAEPKEDSEECVFEFKFIVTLRTDEIVMDPADMENMKQRLACLLPARAEIFLKNSISTLVTCCEYHNYDVYVVEQEDVYAMWKLLEEMEIERFANPMGRGSGCHLSGIVALGASRCLCADCARMIQEEAMATA
jgi:hypothetical protein